MSKKQMIVYVEEEEKALIQERAATCGVSTNKYMVMAALSDKEIVVGNESKEPPVVKIETDDLFGLLNEVRELREKFSQASNSIIKTGVAYPRELDIMNESIGRIEKLITQKTYEEIDTRKKIKDAAKEILNKTIE